MLQCKYVAMFYISHMHKKGTQINKISEPKLADI